MKLLEKDIEYVQLNKIAFDVNNPRGEKEYQIVSDSEFQKLISSIDKFGILEPLIVKKNLKKKGFFELIDGERRLRAAIRAIKSTDKDKTVPALIAKDDTDGRILAYQVHMLRKNWSKVAETKSIKRIIADIKQENLKITDKTLNKKLKEITAHSGDEISDLLKLIKYDDNVIEKVITGKIDMSYLIQIEASFISPLKRKYLSLLEKYGENNLRKILVEKAENGLLVNTRFLMDKFKYVFADEDKKNKIKKLIDKFLTNKNKNIQEVFDEYLKLNPSLSKKVGKITKLQKTKKRKPKKGEKGEPDTYKKIKLTKKEETSIKKVRSNFEHMGKNLSKEELDYVSEAIYCLEKGCYKASVVMIWAAGISRVIKYISNNLNDFNTISSTMRNLRKPPYIYLKQYQYKIKVTTEEDLRDGKDWQLLNYILYKKFILSSGYRQLKNCYTTRCDCAHPTGIQLKSNKAISIFEDIYDLIFRNKKLK